MIAIIDYNVGNVSAVANMLNRLGYECKITFNSDDIERAHKIILPGNGSFDTCMKNLRNTNLIPLLEKKVLKNSTPLLGICVGAQMLGYSSEEGEESGLGWLDMTVKRLPEVEGLRVPNMGWRSITTTFKNHYLLKDIEKDAKFYFVHSYYMNPTSQKNILMASSFGFFFAAAVVQKNIIGLQFHPEKSHRYGKQLLNAFASGDLIE
jgi:glutamine amidotransferase